MCFKFIWGYLKSAHLQQIEKFGVTKVRFSIQSELRSSTIEHKLIHIPCLKQKIEQMTHEES